MTTLSQYEGLTTILDRLGRVRSRHQAVQLVLAGAGLVAVALAAMLLVAVVAGFWPGQPPTRLRWGLLIFLLAAWAVAAGVFLLLPIRRRLNYAQTARLIEQHLTGLDNSLINALQLSQDESQPSPPLVQSAILETARRTANAPLASAVRLRHAQCFVAAAGLMLAATTALAILAPQRLARGLSAVFRPNSFVRQIGSVKLLSVSPGDATIFAGEQLTVTARIANPQRLHYNATLRIAAPGGTTRTMLTSVDQCSFSCPLGKIDQSFQYCLLIGDSQFPDDRPCYSVTVIQQINIQALELKYTFPVYTRRPYPNRTDPNAAGPIEAPAGSVVDLTLRFSGTLQSAKAGASQAPAVPQAALVKRSGETIPLGQDGNSYTGTLRITQDDAYRIILSDAGGRRLQQVPEVGDGAEPEQLDRADGYWTIRAIPDHPPKLSFLEPNRDVSAPPRAKLPLRLRVSDDYALAKVRLFLGIEGETAQELAGISAFAAAAGKDAADLQYDLELGEQYRLGDHLVYYAAATDNRDLPNAGPQTTESARFKIILQDAAQVAADQAKRADQLRAKLLALLAAQEAQRVNTGIAQTKKDILALRLAGKGLADAQQAIRADMLETVDHFPFDKEQLTVQQALAMLGNNEATAAIAQARVLATLGELDARLAACRELAASQDRIISAIQTLLAILPSLARLDSATRPAGAADLPADVQDKLAQLKSDLEKFMDEQRKVLSATERLAKKPADAFTKEDEKLLKDLLLAQDKWEKFLNEKFADFSKMAQQDFSNPELLKELISVKTDVTMAKDALSKQAAEIATAIEDNGIENARSLSTNIEKWLPDEPDRIKWDMEDPAGQSNAEQPELPSELEDLVGDLLEQEEDLFDEMEDVTSKYAQSGDKGIGWDAMDGPISNMNAQGVTGNQLPNTSEISGRSGEGRQGKAVGEFVEDKAVGKGGRRTPTRLTPEPFQQGQINDTSEEPPGGATGGGKLSGAGSEGLEGPLPPPLKEELKRLAGQHAQLLNKAERVQAGMNVKDYSNYQFLQAITLMKKVQGELENYRYGNSLRERHVTLGALEKTKLLLSGELDITTDATANMPKYVRDDINDAMKAKLPPAYRDALQKYFQRMSEMGEKPKPDGP